MVFSSHTGIDPVYDNGRGCIEGNRILGICRDSCDLLVDVSNGGSVSGGGGGGGLFVLDNGGKLGGVACRDGLGECDGVVDRSDDACDNVGDGDDSMLGMSGISISASNVSLG